MELTIAMSTYRDWEGVWATLHGLRLYHDLAETEILVLDNYGCELTEGHCLQQGFRYELFEGPVGTGPIRNALFERATGDVVLVIDSHVMLHHGALESLRAFYRSRPGCLDLIQGPLEFKDPNTWLTTMRDEWRKGMLGVWKAEDAVTTDELPTEAFEIWGTGMGLFACRRNAWLGLNPHFRGFGGEEGYTMTKYRKAGRRTLCLPGLKWAHRFGRSQEPPYPAYKIDVCRNYMIGHRELGLDETRLLEHFKDDLPIDVLLDVIKDVDLTMAGEVSPREQTTPETPLMQQAEVALDRLGHCERLLLMSKWFGKPLAISGETVESLPQF